MVSGDIDSNLSSRAKVGLTPGTTGALVGWGRRSPGAAGWYLQAHHEPATVLYVLGSDGHGRLACLHGGDAPPLPTLDYHRNHAGRAVDGWAAVEHVAEMVAMPDGDGRFLAAMLRSEATEHLAPGALEALIEWCLSDPVFLLGAIVCPPAPSTWPRPVHDGRLGPHRAAALRAAQQGYELLLGVADVLVDHPGRWGGRTFDVARRSADVMMACYHDLAPTVAADALTRTIDVGALPVVPAIETNDACADELLTRIWATWAAGPRATVDDGRALVRRLQPDLSEQAADTRFVQLVVALQLATGPTIAAGSPAPAQRRRDLMTSPSSGAQEP